MKRLMMGWSLVVAVSAASAQESPAPENTVQDVAGQVVEGKVLVVGQRPGPGLWKVSKNDHVLWIFGTYGPLPEKMEWRSHEVEHAIATSQEYIKAPSGGASVGVLKGLTLLPHVFNLTKNPDGATLKELVPAPVYTRWLSLKARYIGADEGIERERPMFAANALYRAGLKHAGLARSGYQLDKTIETLIKKHKTKVTVVHVKAELDDPAQLMKDFKKSSMDDVACFSKTLDQLETDIDAMRLRANAWAKGDIAVIEQTDFTDRQASCAEAIKNNSAIKNVASFGELGARMRAAWITAAERALTTNKSTFAVLRMTDILKPDGYVAELAAKGYTVEKPD